MNNKAIKALYLLIFIIAVSSTENYPEKVNYLWLTVPDHSDWLYKIGEIATIEVRFFLFGIPEDIEVTYEIGPDMMDATSQGKIMLKDGKANIEIGTMDKPGFLDLRLKTKINDKIYDHHIKVGFSPELLEPYTENPKDFDEFWEKNIEEARKRNDYNFYKNIIESYGEGD
jgi:hypothetical protein